MGFHRQARGSVHIALVTGAVGLMLLAVPRSFAQWNADSGAAQGPGRKAPAAQIATGTSTATPTSAGTATTVTPGATSPVSSTATSTIISPVTATLTITPVVPPTLTGTPIPLASPTLGNPTAYPLATAIRTSVAVAPTPIPTQAIVLTPLLAQTGNDLAGTDQGGGQFVNPGWLVVALGVGLFTGGLGLSLFRRLGDRR